MGPLVSGIANWLKAKFPSAKGFPAPNNELSIRVLDGQYDVFFISSVDDAMTAAASITRGIKYPQVAKRYGVMVATSAAIANDPQIQSAIASNYSADGVYLGYLELHQVKKWPPTAP
jgi:hypothetical protein